MINKIISFIHYDFIPLDITAAASHWSAGNKMESTRTVIQTVLTPDPKACLPISGGLHTPTKQQHTIRVLNLCPICRNMDPCKSIVLQWTGLVDVIKSLIFTISTYFRKWLRPSYPSNPKVSFVTTVSFQKRQNEKTYRSFQNEFRDVSKWNIKGLEMIVWLLCTGIHYEKIFL